MVNSYPAKPPTQSLGKLCVRNLGKSHMLFPRRSYPNHRAPLQMPSGAPATGKERRYAKGLLWLSQLIPSPRCEAKPSTRLLSGKTLRSVLAVPPSLNLWRSRLLPGRCAPVLACVLARLRRLDVKTAATISILVHLVTLLMWHSAAAVKRAVTFQGGWAAKPGPGPGPGESKVAVHQGGCERP